MQVFYIDSGMVNEIGHHATSCRLITAALRERGHEVAVFGWTGLDPALVEEFAARASLRNNTYASNDGDPLCGWLAGYFIAAQSLAEDLARLGPFAADDLLYVNSVQPAQLHGVHLFLAALPDAARPQTVVELGTDPGVDFVFADGSITLTARDPRQDSRATLYRFAAKQMANRRLPQLHPVTFDRTSSDVYAMLLSLPVGTLPLPHLAPAPPRRRGGPGARTVAFLGHQRGEKGFELVPEIARLLLAARGDVRLLVHNAQPLGMADTQRAMRALAAADGRIELDERPAGPALWQELLDRSDLIVCPYMPERFRAAYSALASEAVAGGIPLVVPAHTTLARLLQDFSSGGGAFAGHAPDQVVAAIIGVLDDFAVQAARAAEASARWAETMGAGNMVDAMLARVAAATMEQRAPDRLAA